MRESRGCDRASGDHDDLGTSSPRLHDIDASFPFAGFDLDVSLASRSWVRRWVDCFGSFAFASHPTSCSMLWHIYVYIYLFFISTTVFCRRC